MPNATSVRDPEQERQRHEPPVGVLHRVPEHDRVADPAQEHAHADQRADRHEQAPGLDPVEASQLRSLGAGRLRADRRGARRGGRRAGRGHRRRRGSSPRAPAAWSTGSAAATVSLPRTRTAAATARSGPDDGGGRGEELGDVAGGLAEPGAAGREVEAHDATARRPCRRRARACRRACRGRRAPRAACAPAVQHVVEQLVAHRVGIEVVELGARRPARRRAARASRRAGHHDARACRRPRRAPAA